MSNLGVIQGVQEKISFFSKFTATTITSLWETFKALKAMRVYSHSYWLVIFYTTNSGRALARERWQTLENFWKKHVYWMSTLLRNFMNGLVCCCTRHYTSSLRYSSGYHVAVSNLMIGFSTSTDYPNKYIYVYKYMFKGLFVNFEKFNRKLYCDNNCLLYKFWPYMIWEN